MIAWTSLVIAAYLLGSIPVGLMVARVMGGPDPRLAGSGNIGAANLFRLLGRGAGTVTVAGDVLKGALPLLLARHYFPAPVWVDELAVSAVGLAAVAGHLWPLYLGFQGGKGVATGFGVVAVASPGAALLSLLVYLGVLWYFRIFSLGSLAAAWFLPLALGLCTPSRIFLLWGGLLSLLIILRHRSNLARLAAGEEPRMSSAPPASGTAGGPPRDFVPTE